MPHLFDAPMNPFTVTVQRPRPGVRVLLISGELDIATASCMLGEALQRDDPASAQVCRLVIDMSAVSFLSSAGLHALWSCVEQAPAVILVGVAHRPVAVPLRISGLDAILPTHPDIADALAALN